MTEDLVQVAHDSARGSFYLSIGNLASTVIQAIGTFIIVRLLGTELYGVYTLSITIPTMLVSLVNFGINEGMIKYLSSFSAEGKKEQITKLVSHSILFNTCVGILFFLACFVFSNTLATYAIARPQYADYLRFASFLILLQVTFNSASAVFIGLNTMEYSAFTSVIAAIIKTVVASTLVIAGLSVTGAITGVVTSWLAAALVGMLIIAIKFYRPLRKQSIHIRFSENTKMLLKYGLPLYVSTIVVTLNTQVQNLILPFFTSDTEIGAYRAAANFTVLITVITTSISSALFPAFSRISAKSEGLQKIYTLAVKYTCIVLLPIVLLLITFSHLAVSAVYGFDQSSTSFYLALICLQFFLAGLGSIILSSLFNGIGKTKINLNLQIITFIVLIVLAPILTQTYGVTGLIISNFIAATVSTAYGARIAKKETNASPKHRNVGGIYLAAFIPFALLEVFLYFFPLNSILMGLLIATGASLCYLLLYLTLLPLLKILTLNELVDLERVTKRTRSLALIAKPFFKYEHFVLTKTQRSAKMQTQA